MEMSISFADATPDRVHECVERRALKGKEAVNLQPLHYGVNGWWVGASRVVYCPYCGQELEPRIPKETTS